MDAFAEDMPTEVWNMENGRFWAYHPCDGLFLMFDTSAHIGDGVPGVSHDDVIEHVSECDECQDADTRVALDVHNVGTLEYSYISH